MQILISCFSFCLVVVESGAVAGPLAVVLPHRRAMFGKAEGVAGLVEDHRDDPLVICDRTDRVVKAVSNLVVLDGPGNSSGTFIAVQNVPERVLRATRQEFACESFVMGKECGRNRSGRAKNSQRFHGRCPWGKLGLVHSPGLFPDECSAMDIYRLWRHSSNRKAFQFRCSICVRGRGVRKKSR